MALRMGKSETTTGRSLALSRWSYEAISGRFERLCAAVLKDELELYHLQAFGAFDWHSTVVYRSHRQPIGWTKAWSMSESASQISLRHCVKCCCPPIYWMSPVVFMFRSVKCKQLMERKTKQNKTQHKRAPDSNFTPTTGRMTEENSQMPTAPLPVPFMELLKRTWLEKASWSLLKNKIKNFNLSMSNMSVSFKRVALHSAENYHTIFRACIH